MADYTARRGSFLDKIFAHEDGPQEQTLCSHCKPSENEGSNPAIYHCDDCTQLTVLCKDCILKEHLHQSYHHLRRWELGFFKRCSLKYLGARLYLGHHGHICAGLTSGDIHDKFVVTDINGIHQITVVFCHCSGSGDRVEQLLTASLFPATTTQPSSAFTFNVLRHFHKMTNQTVSSAYSYFQGLRRLTNDIDTTMVPVSPM